MHGSVPTFFGNRREAPDKLLRVRGLCDGRARHRRVGARPPACAGATQARAPFIQERSLLSQRPLPAAVVRASLRRSARTTEYFDTRVARNADGDRGALT